MCMDAYFVTMEVPVPIGTPVFVIADCYCYTKTYAERCRIRNGRATNNASAIAIFQSHNVKRGFRCKKIYVHPFDPTKHLAKWDKSVFKSYEAAVAAINKEKGEAL